MTTVKRIENQIKKQERFSVKILHGRDFRDVRDDKAGLEAWPLSRAAKATLSVAAWTKRRFKSTYPGFTVEVLDAAGHVVSGRTTLGTARENH